MLKLFVLFWKSHRQGRSDHADRSATSLDCTRHRGRVDPLCKSRNNRESFPDKFSRQTIGALQSDGRDFPRPDNRDAASLRQSNVAAIIKQFDWILRSPQFFRIIKISMDADRESGKGCEESFDLDKEFAEKQEFTFFGFQNLGRETTVIAEHFRDHLE